MARRGPGRRGKDSASAWFRNIFAERPDWLEGKSNEEVRAKWIAEHPPHRTMPDKIQGTMANVKSLMRRKKREEGESGSGNKLAGRSPETAQANDASVALENLEVSIDDCLITAYNLDRDGLHEVIRLLRKARDTLVLKSGE
jgi:hypothetical protein